MANTIRGFITGFLELFFPRLCVTCKRRLFTDEKYLCLHCILGLPKTNFHNDANNKVAQLFWGRVPVEYATAWLFFRKGSKYQRLIHFLKYKGVKDLGKEMGNRFGEDILDSPFGDVDIILPVPLHEKKFRQRGYNQSERIASGLAEGLKKPLQTENLVRIRSTDTQTRKGRFQRWQNVEGVFSVVDPNVINGRHILLTDDVITTGSTLEAAVQALRNAGVSKVSIAALAYAEI